MFTFLLTIRIYSFMPPDACFYEIMRFRVRPPKAKELPLNVRPIMNIAGSKVRLNAWLCIDGGCTD
jgi:hypothetical protein